MQATINFIQAVANTSGNTLKKALANAKATLSNETTQKMVLFATILGLLFLAANLDKIM